MAKRYFTLFCDESAKDGLYFSNFYGGALVKSEDREAIETLLSTKKAELNITGEMKWTKITKNYQEKYIEFIKFYFEFVESGRIKVRIMFTHNYRRPKGLTTEHRDNEYFILYYQMLKHAFGFQYANPNNLDKIYISMLLDEIPHSNEKLDIFKTYISGIEKTSLYRGKGIYFPRHDIVGVKSHDHSILQGLDIILGSMYFRLNDYHKQKPTGQRNRAKRTIAKEKVYKEINRSIAKIYPNFNIGTSTGSAQGSQDRWEQPYRHWCFRPNEFEIDESVVKPR